MFDLNSVLPDIDCRGSDVPMFPDVVRHLEVILLDDRIAGSTLLTGVIHGAIKEIQMLRETIYTYESFG